MGNVAKLTTSSIVSDVACLGSQVSHALHNFASLQNHIDQRLAGLLGHLNATVQTLNQLEDLLKGSNQGSDLLSEEGLKYVETLAYECSIAISRIHWIVTGDRSWANAYAPQYWKGLIWIESDGKKKLVMPEINEAAIYRELKASRRTKTYGQMVGIIDRLGELQMLLLLVDQVITVREMTKELPSGVDNLKTIVEYHARISRAAELAGIASGQGKMYKRKSRIRRISSSISSGSDSETYVRRGPPPPPPGTRLRGPPPPPPPGWFGPTPRQASNVPPPPPPGWNGPAPKSELSFPSPSPQPPPGWVGPPLSAHSYIQRGPPPPPPPGWMITEQNNINDNHPPSYSEKDRTDTTQAPGLHNSPTALNKQDIKISNESSPDQLEKEKSSKTVNEVLLKTSVADNCAESTTTDNAHLLNGKSSGFGMKFKSLFRSNSSLEAEMKRTLADANATLAAFVIQQEDFKRVPHSAFHSLEYTHMRTILSQLKDSTWFKTFSELTESEHEALGLVLSERSQNGKSLQRELVVLKVLQQNRFNAWVRVIEQCFGTDSFGPRYENGRIVLAIVRDKESTVGTTKAPVPNMSAKGTSPKGRDIVPAPPVPDLFSHMPRNGKFISDLSKTASVLEPRIGGPPPPGGFRDSPPQWIYDERPPLGWDAHPSFYGPRRELPYLGFQSYSSITNIPPRNTVSESSARRVLTSFLAFTIRPAPAINSAAVPLLHNPPTTWARCFITREHEQKPELLKRIDQFEARGTSIIDIKLQLTESQSAQLARLAEEMNQLEPDSRFEHKMVELSMADVVNATVIYKSEIDDYVDVIHVIVQRAPKDGISCVATYDALIRPPPRGPPPPPPPPPPAPIVRSPPDDIVIVQEAPRRGRFGGKGRRSVASSVSLTSSSSGSGSGSDSYFSDSDSDDSRTRYSRKRGKGKGYNSSSGSDSDSLSSEYGGKERKPRWKSDPTTMKVYKREIGEDVVQVLVARWTGSGVDRSEDIAAEAKEKAEEKAKKEKRKRDRKSKKSHVSDSLADD